MTIMKRTMFVLILGTLVQCASDLNSNLEEARFQLDQGNYTAAIDAATAALVADPGNVEATRILGNAYFGRSGLDFLDIAAGMLDLDSSDTPNFQQIAGILPDPSSITVDIDDLRSAIDALEGLTGVDDATIPDGDLADAVFDLATMQMVEHFAIGVYESDYLTSDDTTTVDVSAITDADRQVVQDDLVNFDNRLIASGVGEDEGFIPEVRQTFCILKDISAAEGFTLAEYQALVGCQLSDDPTQFNTAALTADIANCAALEPNDADPCLSEDTAL